MKYIVVLICMLLITIPISSIAETMSDNKTLKLNAIKSDCPQHNNPIHPCGPTSNWFGFSVSLDEEYAIVGAPFSSAYVYKHDGTSWLKEQKLTASGDFGYSVSIDGEYAIVGAPDYDTAYVFKRDGINWVEEAKLTASDSGVGDIFGKSVSISGDYAIVGNPRSHNIYHNGTAYIFKREGTSWNEDYILSVHEGGDDQFGWSVSIDGDYAIVGAYYEDNLRGAAYIFKHDGTEWPQQARLVAPDGAAGDNFGRIVSINGNYAIVGVPADDEIGQNSGSAYVFRRDGTSWIMEEKLIPIGDYGPWYGWSVSIDGEYAIVGTYLETDNYRDFGKAYVFKRNGTEWSQQARLAASDGIKQNHYFAISVSIKGDYAFVGAPARNVGSRKDSVYIFKRIGEDWIEEQKLILIPRARLTLFMKLLDSFPNAFPILRFLLTK